MTQQTANKTNETQLIEALQATNKQLIMMYLKGTNKFAIREMKLRGIY